MAEFQQIVVKLIDDVNVPYEDGIETQLRDQLGAVWDAVAAQVPFDLTLLRLYVNDDIFDLVDAARQAVGDQAPNLLRWFRMPFPDGADADSAAALLSGLPLVEQAFVETIPVPAVSPTSLDPQRQFQDWQDPSPTGVDVDAARVQPGGLGAGVNYVCVDFGWRLDHIDLVDLGLSVEFGANNTSIDFGAGPQDPRLHGTPVLAIAAATETGVGGVGIAPQTNPKLVSAFDPALGGNVFHSAITTAIGRAGAGGVVCVPIQGRNQACLEMNPTCQAEFLTATSLGVTMVVSAGNGGIPLDNFQDFFGRRVLDRSSPDFFDSGSVVVGAATSTDSPRTWLPMSNFGSRVDCWTWGENILTAAGTGPTDFDGFTGTSFAAAIIAGVVVVIQGMGLAKRGQFFTPAEIRQLLLNGSDVVNAAGGFVGSMPDLATISSLI